MLDCSWIENNALFSIATCHRYTVTERRKWQIHVARQCPPWFWQFRGISKSFYGILKVCWDRMKVYSERADKTVYITNQNCSVRAWIKNLTLLFLVKRTLLLTRNWRVIHKTLQKLYFLWINFIEWHTIGTAFLRRIFCYNILGNWLNDKWLGPLFVVHLYVGLPIEPYKWSLIYCTKNSRKGTIKTWCQDAIINIVKIFSYSR